MNLWKRSAEGILAGVLLFSMSAPVHAEGEDFSDTSYWMNLCTGGSDLSPDEKTSCREFLQYQSESSTSLQNQVSQLEDDIAQASEDIEAYAAKAQYYQEQAATLNDDIADLNGQIAVKERQIEALQADIDKNQAEVDAGEEKMKQRLETIQQTMRLNQYFDILMGARTFEQLIRLINGLNDITEHDNTVMEQLSDQITQLNSDKAELETQKASLDADRQELVDKQNELLAYMVQAQQAETAMEQQLSLLQEQRTQTLANISQIQEQMSQLQNALNSVAASAGWTYPIPGAHINAYAHTWHYASGGIHLGADFVAPLGTTVVAPANGVVLASADGCDYGYLGNGCGVSNGGVWGGGNQIYILCVVNGSLYCVLFAHLLKGTPLASGTIVTAGQAIAQVGSSGNSTGPHSHVEIFYLGSGSLFSTFGTTWNGNLSFGCGWHTKGLSNTCDNTGGKAPCRVRPEDVFGG